jgi:hypothetical protein
MTNRKSAKINVLSVRVTNERLDEIEVEAARENMTRTAYIQYLIDQPIRPPIRIEAVRDLEIYRAYLPWLQELKCQGNNLNQIARGINRANLEGITVNNYVRSLNQVRTAYQQIAQSIERLGDLLK